MRDLVDTTEMYLRTVYELEEEGITPLRARIAERLEQSGPTVSQTVARMERDGLIVVEHDRSLSLTDAGRERATAVMRKHPQAKVHLYGKDHRPGRKMGHVNVCAGSVEEALAVAEDAAHYIIHATWKD